MCLFPIIVFLPSRVFSALSCRVFLRGHHARSLSSHSTSTSGPALKTSQRFPCFDSLLHTRKLPETKDLHSTFITVFMTKQRSTAAENISERWGKKLLLIRSLLRKNQIKPIDLITHRLHTLMVIAKYKCVRKGTDSPKVQICVETAVSVFNL